VACRQVLRRGKLLATVVKNLVLLPIGRMKLKRLEQAPHVGLSALPLALSQEAAATPTPQSE
jgi:hypothetical protein